MTLFSKGGLNPRRDGDSPSGTGGSTRINFKKIIGLTILCLIAFVGLFITPMLVDTVEKGTYQIKQAAVTGTMSAKMTPGLWYQGFGDIDVWSKAETFYFTADEDEGESRDQSVEVRFVDGSLCRISGTSRIMMPTIASEAIALTTEHGYKTYSELEHKLLLPTIRNALRLTANLMTAQESYADKRTDFVFWASDQIEHGLYETIEEEKKIKDLISGDMVTKTFKVIKTEGKNGPPIYQSNPLAGTGITLKNFEIKSFQYAPAVKKQIATQQEAYMAVATAKAKASEAEQNKLTIEAQGKAAVAKAKYEKEQEKVRAVVAAQQAKEVKIIGAEQRKDSAKLDRDAAKFTKEEQILLGEGEAERKRLVLAADGALAQKLKTYEKVSAVWADAHKTRPVPTVMMGGGSGEGNTDSIGTVGFSEAVSLMALKQLGLDMTIPAGRTR
ncbi:hypothetical protein KAR91_13115 [Candidatus Pacearchaeota archaeon]|nr:hypothetical protein [Candidatus Pacearchaeota archaeon]